MFVPGWRRGGVCVGSLVVLCWLAASGCSSNAPNAESSLTEATVTGRVVSPGKPITKGQVVFDPANVNRPRQAARTAEIGPDGTYQVKTLIGDNRVTVAIPGRPRPAGSPYVQQISRVQPGENQLDITVP